MRDVAVHVPDLLAGCFESLGDLCELGIVQGFCGAGIPGLLRVASLPLEALVDLLDTDLATLLRGDGVSVFRKPGGGEWWGRVASCALEYHTGRDSGAVDAHEALRGEQRRVPFLSRKLLDQLREPQKVFVRYEIGGAADRMAELARALRRHGDHRLLWVDHTAEDARIGAVEPAGDGVVRGFIGHFWRDAAPSPDGLGIWLGLLGAALSRLRPEVAAGLRRVAADRAASWRDVLVSPPRGMPAVHTMPSRDVPSPDGGQDVPRHVLRADTTPDDGLVVGVRVTGTAEGCLFVLSAWVWLPAGFEGHVFAACPGFGWVRMWPADAERTACWQRVVTSLRMPRGAATLYGGVVAVARLGCIFYSADLRIEPGVVPVDCLSRCVGDRTDGGS